MSVKREILENAGAQLQVEVRITAPLQWGARPGEGAGFHFRLDSAEGDGNANSELTENVEVRIPSEEVLEALESIRRARSSEERNRPEFRVRHRIRYFSFHFVLYIGMLDCN